MLNLSKNLRSLQLADGQAQPNVPAKTSAVPSVSSKPCLNCGKNRRKTRANGLQSLYCSTQCSRFARCPISGRGSLISTDAVSPFNQDGIQLHAIDPRLRASVTKSRLFNADVGKTSKDNSESISELLKSIPLSRDPVFNESNEDVTIWDRESRQEYASFEPGTECIQCKKRTGQSNVFCSRSCGKRAQDQAPCIIRVPEGHDIFKNVENQFKDSWRHRVPACPPAVRFVYKVMMKKSIVSRYEAYRGEVEERRNFQNKGRRPGNECRRWHGTLRCCDIGDHGSTTLCSLPTCSLCSILRNSFQLVQIKNKTSFKRFGTGFYTTSTSSKAKDYSRNSTGAATKAVLLNKVVVGRGSKDTPENQTITEPPLGYDSVLGEVGERLNYDEIVVYREDALIPSYLVIFDAVP